MHDHLNRYSGMRDYIESKKLIFKFQKTDDYLILNSDDKIVRGFGKKAKAKIIFYSKKQAKKYKKYIQILGEHNLNNISAAIAVAKIFKIKDEDIKKTLKNFRGIEGRIEFIKEINKVKYYNDTTATSPDATIAAINSFPGKKIILIAGGTDKNLDFKKLAKEILKRVKLLILLPGTATKKIEKVIKIRDTRLLARQARYEIQKAKNMQKAVKIAKKQAKKSDFVLLSPGCASFGLFQHEFDRGEQFVKCVKNL